MNPSNAEGLIIAEKTMLLKFDKFTICKGLLFLIALYYVYYINYPNSCPASGLLLFIQEVLLDVHEENCKKSAKYNAFIDSIIS